MRRASAIWSRRAPIRSPASRRRRRRRPRSRRSTFAMRGFVRTRRAARAAERHLVGARRDRRTAASTGSPPTTARWSWHDFALRHALGRRRCSPSISIAARHLSRRGVRRRRARRRCSASAPPERRCAATSARSSLDDGGIVAADPAIAVVEPSRWSAPASASASPPSATRVASRHGRRTSPRSAGAARRHQLRLLPAGTEKDRCQERHERSSSRTRARPSEAAARRAWSRWRGCRCSSRSTASARWSPAAAPAAAWKAELLSAAGAQCRCLSRTSCRDEMLALAADPPRGAIVLHRRAWTRRRSCRRGASRSARSTTTTKRRASPPRRARPASRSTSSTSRRSAISRSARSSTARRW